MRTSICRTAFFVFLVCVSPWLHAQDATVYMRSGISLPAGSVVDIEHGVLRYKSGYGE